VTEPKKVGGKRPGAGRPRRLKGERVRLSKMVLRRHVEAIRGWGAAHGIEDEGDALRDLLDHVAMLVEGDRKRRDFAALLPSKACEPHAEPGCAPDD
jgi:hypothetical protein